MDFVIENAHLHNGSSFTTGQSIVVRNGIVEAVGEQAGGGAGNLNRIDAGGARLVPGFVDIQVNGGGGVLLNNQPTLSGVKAIAAAHLKYGTTSLLPTLISDDFEVMREAIAAVREAIDVGVPGILGIHLEGPFLNSKHKGAHDSARFRTLDDHAIELITSLGRDAVTLLTLAPENTTPDRIRELRRRGVYVFAGHTAATYEQCKEAEVAGLTGYTHLFNAMTPLKGRAPGVVGAALDSDTAVFGIIADGHHVHPAALRLACNAAPAGRGLLVTDAMATVGSDQNFFLLNGEQIDIRDGALRNAAGSLAGSNLSMIQAVQNIVSLANISWEEAVRMASTYPARAIDRTGLLGCIKPGAHADFVLLDEDLNILKVWQEGELAQEHEENSQ